MVKSHLPPSSVRACVLIVDDEEPVRVALRTILQSEYDIIEARSASEGLELLKEKHADLVTLDLWMPGSSGLEALRTIRASDEHLPVILITGHASLDSACEALKLGATDYIQKPFRVDELRTSIRNGLRRREIPVLVDVAKSSGIPHGITQDSLALLGKASAAFVHDIASPLQVLTILASLCSKSLASPQRPEVDADLRESVAQMESLLVWAVELVKGWQSIAVPSPYSRELLDVATLLDHAIAIVKPYAQLNRVLLTRAELPQKMEVVGDRIQLERALVNISLNGIKASTARVRVVEWGAYSRDGQQVFRCTDSGLGFPREKFAELMESDPFDSTAHSRRGLGLFIADWIAENHGGTLRVECEPGLSTTVNLLIPSVAAKATGTRRLLFGG